MKKQSITINNAALEQAIDQIAEEYSKDPDKVIYAKKCIRKYLIKLYGSLDEAAKILADCHDESKFYKYVSKFVELLNSYNILKDAIDIETYNRLEKIVKYRTHRSEDYDAIAVKSFIDIYNSKLFKKDLPLKVIYSLQNRIVSCDVNDHVHKNTIDTGEVDDYDQKIYLQRMVTVDDHNLLDLYAFNEKDTLSDKAVKHNIIEDVFSITLKKDNGSISYPIIYMLHKSRYAENNLKNVSLTKTMAIFKELTNSQAINLIKKRLEYIYNTTLSQSVNNLIVVKAKGIEDDIFDVPSESSVKRYIKRMDDFFDKHYSL